MNKLEFQGRIYKILDTQQVTETFKKREVILQTESTSKEGEAFTQLHGFQFTQNKCDDLDRFKVGEEVKISFNVRTNENIKNGVTRYFTSVNAWKIELVAIAQQPQQGQYQNWSPPQNQQAPQFPQQPASNNDLPF